MIPDPVMKYFSLIMLPKRALPAGADSELRTIAEALDALLAGNLARACDILSQRFRAVDLQSSGEANWTQARLLEVTTPTTASTVPVNMRSTLVKELKQINAATGKGGPSTTGGGKTSEKGKWDKTPPWQVDRQKGAYKGWGKDKNKNKDKQQGKGWNSWGNW